MAALNARSFTSTFNWSTGGNGDEGCTLLCTCTAASQPIFIFRSAIFA
jgi:hypothetical protein